MNKQLKGAIAMVLAGSITFSVTNTLLAEPIKRLTKEIALPAIQAPKKAVQIGQAEKTGKNETSPIKVKVSTNQVTHDHPVSQMAAKNKKAGDLTNKKMAASTAVSSRVAQAAPKPAAKAAVQTVTGISKQSQSSPTITAKTAAAPTAPATSTRGAAVPAQSGANTKSTATINRGQEVSQTAKEKNADQRDQKVNNGKKL